MHKAIKLIVTAAIWCWVAGSAQAASDQQTLTINANVAARAKLSLLPSTINFPDADPDDYPAIAADSPVAVAAKVRTGASSTATLSVLANGDLVGGSDTIPIDRVSWTASGAGFVGGTLSKSVAQPVASWSGSGSRSGTLNFSLVNDWSYATGNYTQTAVYTLTAP